MDAPWSATKTKSVLANQDCFDAFWMKRPKAQSAYSTMRQEMSSLRKGTVMLSGMM